MNVETINPGLIFDIKKYSINDGPGIRVTVFFKGCPLSCVWCHNPESQSFDVQKLYSINKCIACNSCVTVCPNGALSALNGSGIITNRELCTLCGKCAEECPSKAIEMCGKEMSVEAVMKEIRKESQVIRTSGGGVTFSGGEPLAHPDFLMKLLVECGNEGFHRTVDTSGYVKWEVLKEIASQTDLFLYDLKLMDPVNHRKYTGLSNELILSNLRALSEYHPSIIIRIPLIEGINTDLGVIQDFADFIVKLPGPPKPVNLLPYHSIATHKYMKMGTEAPAVGLKEPGTDLLNTFIQIFTLSGIKASIGG